MPDDVQALEALGTVTAADYANVFAPLVGRARNANRRLRLLYQFGADFERLTLGALLADTRLGISYLPLLDGCALVSDVNWIREPARHLGRWMPCPVRVYANNERDEAAAWLASLPKGANTSIPQMARAYIGGTIAAVVSIGKLLFRGDIRRGRRGH
ncbi:STAS/SEC14 domain-containing protein [Mycobacterium riyadhense]|uniref:STAS/SEC14 domain-containing protein n=1 Tax=Mycobacterium riyadhense TaxID=486698 RepID=UPI001EF9D394|nr:STAS/SEC14 domain-containing protein [Mycobacterium riyadhense]